MRETIVKRLVTFSSPLFALGLLATISYTVRELIAALAIFSFGFAALFLIAVVFLLCLHVTDRGPEWLQTQAPQWNRASRDWMVALFRSGQTPVLIPVNVQSPTVRQLNRRVAFARRPE
jgi:hypothetical protein